MQNHFETEFKEAETFKADLKQHTTNPEYKGSRSLTHKWDGMAFSQDGKEPEHTGFDREKLVKIAKATVETPDHIEPH